ncbi:AraC family transcriptional regulator [Vibrio sp. T187]|uniref:AraC family transcriptional regulator n=1 Tax=Vibrio TaxID=662 RepID=UPI0010C95500|nr:MULTISPECIES: AraC family transcriptional regulator [Vibrio]MBW3698250.1 AraC family transcriptional regulator [Vibrio sp. T187]
MKRVKKFSYSPSWKLILIDMGINPDLVLKYAKLPMDLFNRENFYLTPAEYYQLWHGIEAASEQKEAPLLFAQYMTVETFDPPIFASICSPDLNTALKRLSQYKPLIGPMVSDVKIEDKHTSITIHCYGYDAEIPKFLSASELIFFTQLARLATRQTIQPISVELPQLPNNIDQYEAYFGCPITLSNQIKITFKAQDAALPFLTENAAMWTFFEGSLNQKLIDLDNEASTSEHVKSVLLESLPSGESSLESVANKLAVSKRTLQRKLTNESVSFQSILQEVRGELADHYLQHSGLSLGEISFLLGFKESNSFIRAYSGWKGISPGSYREQVH